MILLTNNSFTRSLPAVSPGGSYLNCFLETTWHLSGPGEAELLEGELYFGCLPHTGLRRNFSPPPQGDTLQGGGKAFLRTFHRKMALPSLELVHVRFRREHATRSRRRRRKLRCRKRRRFSVTDGVHCFHKGAVHTRG